MFRKIVLILLALLCLTGSFAAPAAAAETLGEALDRLVEYYEDNKPQPDHWEEIVGLGRAGALDRFDLGQWQADLDGSVLKYASTILALEAAGLDPYDYNGVNLVAELAAKQQPDGSFGGSINNTVYAVLALDRAGGSYNVSGALDYIVSQQKSDGGFSISGSSDPDTTGQTIMALADYSVNASVYGSVYGALDYLRAVQLDSGGFASYGTENTESIAYVIQGLVAWGEDVTAWSKGGNNIIQAMFNFRLADGSFAHTSGGPVNNFATRQALMAMADLKDSYASFIVGDGGSGGGEDPGASAVKVRVEGAQDTLASGALEVDGTALDALRGLVGTSNVLLDSYGMVSAILGESGNPALNADTMTSWLYYVVRNGEVDAASMGVGPDGYNVAPGDEVIFYIGAYDTGDWSNKTYIPAVNISPSSPAAGQTLTVSVSGKSFDWGTGGFATVPLDPVTVAFNGGLYETVDGQVQIPLAAAGAFTLKVYKQHPDGYPELVRGSVAVNVAPRSGGGPVEDETITVYLRVWGKDRKQMYAGSVSIDASEPQNPIYALKQTGLSVVTGYNGQYVSSINGIKEDTGSTAGWKYRVNGMAPGSVSAGDYQLEDGDEVEWFWALDENDLGPGSPGSTTTPPDFSSVNKQARKQAAAELDQLTRLLPGLAPVLEELFHRIELAEYNVVVLSGTNSMTAEEREKWSKWLEQNRVRVSQSVDPGDDNEVTDTPGDDSEINLSLPGGSLDSRVSIEIYELAGPDLTVPDTHRLVSSVYDLGPDGLTFNKPVYLRIKIAGFAGAWENLVLAWYDSANDRWVPAPSVIDPANGEISGLINHFTNFAVLSREKQPVSFSDVGDGSYEWARKEIQYLALKGIVAETAPGRFEPGRPITRGEFVVMLAKALGVEAATDDKPGFTDLRPEDKDYELMQAACAAGLVMGYSDGTLRAGEQVTREQIAVLISRALDLTPVAAEPVFTDGDQVSAWAGASVIAASESGLFGGFPDGSFKPGMFTERAQAAVLIYRILSLKVN